MTETTKSIGVLLVLAATVALCVLVAGGSNMDNAPRPPHPHCEHAP